MIKLIRQLAAVLSTAPSEEDRRDAAPHGMLAQTLRCELAYQDNILRVLSGSRG